MIQFVFLFLTILYTLSIVEYTRWQVVDEQDGIEYGKSDSLWHKFGFISRLIVVTLIIFSAYSDIETAWYCFPFILFFNAFLFDVGINIRALNKDWDYIPEPEENSPVWDKLSYKWKWKFYLIGLAASTVFWIIGSIIW